jgi:hypothetical protein
MKSGSSSNQINALLSRTGHTVWHHDWKIIVGVGVLFILDAAWLGWRSADPRRRNRRF